MAFRFIVPALAVAGRVVAQQCGSGGTTTIQNAGDASALGSCSTYSGTIAVATGTTDDLDFGDLQAVDGSLEVTKVDQLSSISGAGLRKISDTFLLREVQILTNLNFPQLSEVDTLNWNALPNLNGLSFTTGLQMVKRMGIQNTGLQSLAGINLRSVDEFFVVNNNQLNEIDMQLEYVETALTLAANGDEVSVSFPNMQWAFNVTLRNVTEADFPSLSSLNGSMGFYSNFMTKINLANLTEVGSSLAFVSNEALTNISLPELTKIGGGLQIANNTDLSTIDGFPKLESVGGAIDINGAFKKVEFPALEDVRGAMNLQSTKDISSICDRFEEEAGSNKVIKGKYTCVSNNEDPSGLDSDGSSSSDSSSVATAVYISGPLGVLGVLAAVFGML